MHCDIDRNAFLKTRPIALKTRPMTSKYSTRSTSFGMNWTSFGMKWTRWTSFGRHLDVILNEVDVNTTSIRRHLDVIRTRYILLVLSKDV